MMEVTEEMIKAVEALKRAKDREYEQECARRHRENVARIENEAKVRCREEFPDLTEKQFDHLVCTFARYFEEMWDR